MLNSEVHLTSGCYSGLRGNRGLGFLGFECLVKEVEFINNVKYEKSMWMKVNSDRGRETLYIG